MIKALHKERMCCSPHDAFSTAHNNMGNFAQKKRHSVNEQCIYHKVRTSPERKTPFILADVSKMTLYEYRTHSICSFVPEMFNYPKLVSMKEPKVNYDVTIGLIYFTFSEPSACCCYCVLMIFHLMLHPLPSYHSQSILSGRT